MKLKPFAMNTNARFQKVILLAHIISSVGWLGAIVPYLALAIAGIGSHDQQETRAACLSMELIGWFVIVPLSLAALLTGLIQSLITRWGLLRHWWVLTKLVLTIFAIAILFQHMREVSQISLLARDSTTLRADLRPELIHSTGGLLVLLVVAALSVFKPWGMTPYGRRRTMQTDYTPNVEPTLLRQPVIHGQRISLGRIIGFHFVGILVAVPILHLIVFHILGLHHH